MTYRLPTRKQLEKELSRGIQILYKEELGYFPSTITCELFDRYLAIIVEEATTPLEQNLWQTENSQLIEQVRSEINLILKPKLISIIETKLDVEIQEFLYNVTFSTNRMVTLVILTRPPLLRNSKSSHKLNS